MSFPRYPKYKESGVEWLGEVPEHWDRGPLKHYWNVTDCKHVTAEFVDDGIPLASIREVQGRWVMLENAKCTTEHFYELLIEGNRRPVAGDLIFSRNATVGEVAQVRADHPKFAMGQDVVLLRKLSPEYSSDYLQYVIRSQVIIQQLANMMIGSTFKRINVEEIRSFGVPVPPPAEQAAIAEFLDRETEKIDALVAEQQRLIELLEKKRQAVISHAVTKGLNPHAPMKPSGIEWLGDVPAHWSLLALKRVAEIRTGVAKGKDNSSRTTITVPYLRVANVQDGYLDLGSVAMIEIPSSDLERYALKPGDVLMNEGGDFDKLGRGCVWDGQIEPCITQNHVFAVRPRAISSAWLNVITSSDYAQFYFMTRSKQSTNLASISSTNLMELPVIVPPEDEQATLLSFIADQTARCDTLTAEAQRAIDLLQERRTALISAAVTGQIDVRQFAENEIAA